MSETIGLPLWLVFLLAFAALVTLFRFLVKPIAKSWLSTRERSLNQQLRTDLSRKLPEVLRIGRKARIDLFINSSEVRAAVDQAVKENQGTREVLEYRVSEYARELVPGFYALFYFKVGYVLARAYIRLLYDLHIAKQPPPEIADIPEGASIVLVGNHRSNMDVMILAYLASRTNMVSFAAGEWGNAWPMSALLHMSGSYIIRRNETLPLYRKILAIHLRSLVKAKMPQGIFLEGGLTRDGTMQSIKLGLLSYLLSALDENNVQDIVFIPVAFNYDQVPEDKTLLKHQDKGFADRSKMLTLLATFRSLIKVIYKRIRRGKTAYGRAAVSFGGPVSMQAWLSEQNIPRPMDSQQKKQIVTPVSDEIIARIKEMIPVLPVSIVASVLKTANRDILSQQEILDSAKLLIRQLADRQAVMAVDMSCLEDEIDTGLKTLMARKVISKTGNDYEINADAGMLLDYLHNSTKHLLYVDY